MKNIIKIINAILYSIATIMMFIPFMFTYNYYYRGSYAYTFSLNNTEVISAMSLTSSSYGTFGKIASFRFTTKFLCYFLLLCFIASIILNIISLKKEFKKFILITLSGVSFVMFIIFEYYVSTATDGHGDPWEYDYYFSFENTIGVYIVLIILFIALVLSAVATFLKNPLPNTQYMQQNPQQYMQQNMAPLENTNNNFTTTKEPDNFEKINKYKNLLDQGIITQEEFDKKKKELLDL